MFQFDLYVVDLLFGLLSASELASRMKEVGIVRQKLGFPPQVSATIGRTGIVFNYKRTLACDRSECIGEIIAESDG